MPGQLRQFLELIRFSHTVFALPFALMAALLAWQNTPFRMQDLLGILLCMMSARAAAMSFNRLADRHIDQTNPRTSGRHLPAGELSVNAVIVFTIVCSVCFVAATLLFLPNRWPLFLSVPVLAFLLGYSYAKRFTAWSHYWLAAALMLAPPSAWIAICGDLDWPPVLLGGVVFFWVGGFDIIYACQDEQFDRQAGLHSIPARWGVPAALKIAAVSHLLTVVFLFGLWSVAGLGYVFLTGIVVVALLLVYEHRLVRPGDLTRVNIAFFRVNAVVSLGLFFVALADVWIG